MNYVRKGLLGLGALALAKAAEAAGYHAMTIPDSIAYPFESDSTYPYTPDGNREFLDGKEPQWRFKKSLRSPSPSV